MLNAALKMNSAKNVNRLGTLAMDRVSVNSLFIAWLTEWRKEAAEKDLKVQYIYTKALKSIKKYPLTLTSGIECKILEGFGDKLCRQIEERLNKEMQESGTSLLAEEFLKSFDSAKPPKGTRTKFTKIKNKTTSVPVESRHVLSNDHRLCPSGVEGSRPYLPTKRSGAYALLSTLANHFRKHSSDGDGKMEKNELMEEAQSLSDASFKIPSPGSRYTAWSSMGTLVKKGLVKREGCPTTYTITMEGLELADKLGTTADILDSGMTSEQTALDNKDDDDDDDDDVIFVPEPDPEPKKLEKQSSLSSLTSDGSATVSKVDATDAQRVAAKPHWFVYVQEDGKVTLLKDRAVVKIDERTCEVRFLVKCKYEDLLLSGKNYSIDYSRSCTETGDIYAFLSDDDAPDILISGVPTTAPPAVHPPGDLHRRDDVAIPVGRASSHSASSSAPSSKTSSKSTSKSADPSPNVANKRRSSSNDVPSDVVKKKPKLAKSSSGKIPGVSKISTSENSQTQGSRLIDAMKDVDISSGSSTTLNFTGSRAEVPKVLPGEADVVLLPGGFEVVLLVDNRESLGPATKSPSEEMLHKELVKNYVTFEVRQLQLGDFMWVARSAKVELVLDYIVERKRMDDLSSSIIDGRFGEQKFRLSNCGLSKVVYLIEELGKSAQHLSIPETSLEQAIVNTQVVDQFIVKRARSAKELTNYLVLMTRFLQGLYKKKTLYGFKKFFQLDAVESSRSTSSEVCLMDYESFSEHSLKSKCLTVSEMFLKQLTQISGLTAEKACAIIQKYPTPLLLYEAYKNCSGEDGRNKMLADIKCGTLKRNLGPALSKTIANLYS